MTQKIVGSTTETEQRIKKSWTPENGPSEVYTWKGPRAPLEVLYNEWAIESSGASNVDLDGAAGAGTLTVTVPFAVGVGEEGLADKWEILPRVLQIPLAEARSKAGALLFDIGYTPVADRAVELNADPDPNNWAGAGANEEAYLTLRRRGVTHVPAYAWVARRTIAAGRTSDVEASYTDVGCVDAAMPGLLPSGLVGSPPTGEWLKQPPTVRTASRSRYDIVSEWWWAVKWSTILYGGTGVP